MKIKIVPSVLLSCLGLLVCEFSYGDDISMKVKYNGLGTRFTSDAVISSFSVSPSILFQPSSVSDAPLSVSTDNSVLTIKFTQTTGTATVNIKNANTGVSVYKQTCTMASPLTVDLTPYGKGDFILDVTISGTLYEGTFSL